MLRVREFSTIHQWYCHRYQECYHEDVDMLIKWPRRRLNQRTWSLVIILNFSEASHILHVTRTVSSPHTFLLQHRHPKPLPDSRFAAWDSPTILRPFATLSVLTFIFVSQEHGLKRRNFFTRIYLAAGIVMKMCVSILKVYRYRWIDLSAHP